MAGTVTSREPAAAPGSSVKVDDDDWEAELANVNAEIAQVAGVLNAQHARLVALVQQAIDGNLLRAGGYRSVAQWVTVEAALSPTRARQVTALAEARVRFPVVSESFDRGELAIDQVIEAVKAPSSRDEAICDLARVCTVGQLRRVVRGYRFADDDADPADSADPSEPADPSAEPTDRFSLTPGDDGRFRASGDFGPEAASVIRAALEEARDALFQAGHVDASWADALEEMAHRSLDTVTSPQRRDRFKVYLHLDSEGAFHTDGRPMPESLRRHIGCESSTQVVWETDGVPVSVGRTQRIVPERTRRLVMRRDGGCRVPGCDSHWIIEVHHIIHWEDGGSTDTCNLICLCPAHHRLHHQGRLGISGNGDEPDSLLFTDRYGSPIRGFASPVPPSGPPPPPHVPFVRPSGEQLQSKWVSLN